MGSRRQQLLEVLNASPNGLVVDVLLARACPQLPRRLALNALHRLIGGGLVVITEKRHRTEIAGCLVRLTTFHSAQSGRNSLPIHAP